MGVREKGVGARIVPSGDELWSLLPAVTSYSADMEPEIILSVSGREVAKLNERSFFDNLYVRRDGGSYEARLVYELLHGRGFVCLVGGRGCGKTSSLLCALNDLRGLSLPVRILYLDIARVFGASGFQDLAAGGSIGALRGALRQQVLARLFPSHRDSVLLLAWCLAGPPDCTDDFDPGIVADLYEESILIASDLFNDQDSRKRRFGALADLLFNDPSEERRLAERVLPRIRLVHALKASIATSEGVEKIILAVDNIDRLPPGVQSVMYSELIDAKRALGSELSVVVAVRSESIHSSRPEPGEGGYIPSYMYYISDVVGSLLVPETQDHDMYAILRKRIEFVHDLLQIKDDKILALYALQTAVADRFVEAAIHRLSNGSIRSALAAYVEFLRFLTLAGERTMNKAAASPWAAETLLYVFIRQLGNLFEPPFPVISRELGQELGSRSSLYYLLLVATLNGSPPRGRPSDYRFLPKLSDLVAAVVDLGYDPVEVENAIDTLDMAKRESGGELEVLGSGRDKERYVGLTEKGRELVTNLYWKVGYFWWSAVTEMRGRAGGLSLVELIESFPEEFVRTLYGFLRPRAEKELQLIGELGCSWQPRYGSYWLKRYAKNYGIKGELPMQLMLVSVCKFLHDTPKESEPFQALLQSYSSCMKGIEEAPQTWGDILSAKLGPRRSL